MATKVTVVNGSTRTGVYAKDGSINVVIRDGNTRTGVYHPCGAFNVVMSASQETYHPSGAYNAQDLGGGFYSFGMWKNNTGGGLQPVVDPPPAPTSFATTSGALNSSTTTTLAITVPASANRVLIVEAAIPVGANAGTFQSVSLDGVELTLLDSRDLADGARRNYMTLWYLLAPKVGAGTLTFTRTPATGFESTQVRVMGAAYTLVNAKQEAPTVLTPVLTQATDLGSYSLTVTPLVDDTAVMSHLSSDLTSSASTTATMALQSGDTLVGSAQPAGASPYIAVVQGRFDVPASDLITLNLSGASPTARNGIIVSIGVVGVAVEPYVADYYIANEGSDVNDGLSPATAFKTLSPVLGISGGGQINLKAGQRHRPASFASSRILVDFLSAGTALSPIKIRSFGSGARPILDGSVLVPTWSVVSSGEVFSNPNSASIEKITTPPTLHRNQFPTVGTTMLYPAQWPQPSSNDAIDSSFQGSDAFNFYDSSAFSANVSSSGAGPYTVTITDPAIAAHFGASSPKGYVAVVRAVPNVTQECVITAYNQGTSSITFTSSLAMQSPTANAPFYFAIRFHPLDIVRAGQYAWLLDGSDAIINLAGWFGSGERAVAHCSSIFKVDVNYIDIDGVDMARVAANPADSPNTRASFIQQAQSGGVADNLTLKNSKMVQAYDPDRSGAIAVHGPSFSDNWVLEDIEFDEIFTQSGVRGNGLQAATIQRVNIERSGRTGIYLTQANNTVKDVDVSDNISVHGNGITTYVQARNCVIEGVTSLGNTNPATSQVDTYTPGDIKANTWRSMVATGMRRPDGGSETAWCIRFDGGDTNTVMEKITAFGGTSGGMVLSGTAGSNTGMVIQRSAFQSLGTTSSGLNGITLDRVLLCGTLSGLTSLADYTAAGATVINCEIDTGESWNGCLSLKQQKYLTWASGGPGSEVYESVTLGNSQHNWVIPPYGTIGAMVDLGLTRTSVSLGHQGGKTIGCVLRPRPGSTLSLPALGDNALFGLDRGNVYPLSNLTSGNKTLVIRETNASASNGPTRDTSITIIVV